MWSEVPLPREDEVESVEPVAEPVPDVAVQFPSVPRVLESVLKLPQWEWELSPVVPVTEYVPAALVVLWV